MSGPEEQAQPERVAPGWLSSRSTGRVERDSGNDAGQGAEGAQFGDGTVVHGRGRNVVPVRSYLTTAKLTELEASLSDRDRLVMAAAARFRIMSHHQIQTLWFGSTPAAGRAARRCLLRLVDAGILSRLDRRVGGVRAGSAGYLYRLGAAGARLLGARHRAVEQGGLHHVQHTLAVVELYVELARSEGAWRLSRFDPEPNCWRSFVGTHGEPAVLKPDAYVELESPELSRFWFVEIDRGTVSTQSLRTKLKIYRSYLASGTEQHASGVFPRVLWATPAGARRDHISTLIERENHQLGAELHRLLQDEWQPPP
jgi:hypothetical protein